MEDPEQDAFPHLAGHDPGALLGASLDETIGSNNAANWTPPEPDVLSDLISDYEVTTLLGRGGMGAVYRATQTSLLREVAIKLLPPELAADPEFEERFRREACAMAQLNHPNIVQVHDFGQTVEGHCFIIMEFVEGSDLQQYSGGEQLPVEIALNTVSQICDALQYAHEKGYVHRDIKPANIFLNTEGILKVGDFGLARLADEFAEGKSLSPAEQMGLTATGVTMGTPDYIAPEQLTQGETIDRRADLYSLGIMFYQLLTGEIPRGAVKHPSQKIPRLDVRIDGIVYRAMEPDRDSRYQTASELRTDIDALANPAEARKAPPKQSRNRKFPSKAIILILFLIALVTFSFGLLNSRKSNKAVSAIPNIPLEGYPPLPTRKCRVVTIVTENAVDGTAAFKIAGRDDFDDIVALGECMRRSNLCAIRADGRPVYWSYEGERVQPIVDSPAVAVFNNTWEHPLVWVDAKGRVRTIYSADREGLDQLRNVTRVAMANNLLFAITRDGTRHVFGTIPDEGNAKFAFEDAQNIVDFRSNRIEGVDLLNAKGQLTVYDLGSIRKVQGNVSKLYSRNLAATADGMLLGIGPASGLPYSPAYRASYFGSYAAVQPAESSSWQIWKRNSNDSSWERSEKLESALQHAVEVRAQESHFIHALIPSELISRSGVWTVDELIEHNTSLK